MRPRLLPVGIALLLVLAGCAGVGPGADPTGPEGSGDGAPAERNAQNLELNAQVSNDGAAGDGVPQVDPAQRSIIREGRTTLEVSNFSTAREAVVAAARERDGYVGDANRELHRDGDETWHSGYVVLRIPSDEYGTVREEVAAAGTVLSQTTETKDVTDELVDLEARLENLRQRRDRLRDFYDRANSTSELLEVEAELSTVQGEIERLEAEKRSLEQRVSYSTLRVELREPEPEGPTVRTRYHERSLVGTFLGSVGDVYRFGRASLVAIAAALPWLAVAAVPLGVARVAVGRGWLPSPGLRSRFSLGGSGDGGDGRADRSGDAADGSTDRSGDGGE